MSWVFREPPYLGKGPRLAHAAYLAKNLNAHSGFLCLTPKAEEKFRQFAPSRFLPWCVDLELFNGKSADKKPKSRSFSLRGKRSEITKLLPKQLKKSVLRCCHRSLFLVSGKTSRRTFAGSTRPTIHPIRQLTIQPFGSGMPSALAFAFHLPVMQTTLAGTPTYWKAWRWPNPSS